MARIIAFMAINIFWYTSLMKPRLSSSEYPHPWIIRICLMNVLLPDSPVPETYKDQNLMRSSQIISQHSHIPNMIICHIKIVHPMIPYSRGHTRSAYKYKFCKKWGVRLYLNAFSHSVTLSLKVRQGPNRGCANNWSCTYDCENTVYIAFISGDSTAKLMSLLHLAPCSEQGSHCSLIRNDFRTVLSWNVNFPGQNGHFSRVVSLSCRS